MLHNVSSLTDTELQELFVSENKVLLNGIDNGLSFDDLKAARINLRAIVAQLETRNLPCPSL